ncbi:MAG TPA: hypothetical protein VHS31_19820 [Tepidisphaeraceae bacterium]|jgi:hypothetical protein|nr:hypothetical protein [Tepidisphaeraceae bacterium]
MRMRVEKIKVWVVVVMALVLAVLLVVHAPFMNGPDYWKWPWRRL